MIEIYYKMNCIFEESWLEWKIGSFNAQFQALNYLNERTDDLIQMNDFMLKGRDARGIDYYFKFFNVETHQFVSIESTWYVGLNK